MMKIIFSLFSVCWRWWCWEWRGSQSWIGLFISFRSMCFLKLKKIFFSQFWILQNLFNSYENKRFFSIFSFKYSMKNMPRKINVLLTMHWKRLCGALRLASTGRNSSCQNNSTARWLAAAAKLFANWNKIPIPKLKFLVEMVKVFWNFFFFRLKKWW